MSPIQQMLLGVGAVATKTYVDDVFSIQVYTGTSATHAVNTGLDMSGEGGLVWAKARNQAWSNLLIDTVRGGDKVLFSEMSNAQATRSDLITSFNNNGYTAGADSFYGSLNFSTANVAAWNFRKAPGFFDVVEYTGNSSSSSQTISHSLGCVPGMIIVKSLSNTESWSVYHRELNGGVNPANYMLLLDSSSGENASSSDWNNTAPTSSSFTVGIDGRVNGSGDYIAYLFAGGESTAATARSVDFDGSDDKLTIADDSDLDAGSGDYTVECFFKQTAAYTNYLSILAKSGGSLGYWLQTDSSGRLLGGEHGSTFITSTTTFARGVWNHAALVRQSGTMYLYLNGNLEGSVTGSSYSDNSEVFGIGTLNGFGRWFGGEISNVRFVKGTAVYTSSFRPPTEPLTNITNTKLLCCNNSSTTGSTVTPGTITAGSSPTASTDSPFDDPSAFVFGESGSESVIKCGSYVGNGNADGPEINLGVGWEAQWVLIKSVDTSNSWFILDSMRGIVSGGNDAEIYANESDAEGTGSDRISLTPTGFKIDTTSSNFNTSGDTYIFMCIRRSDGYVGKPPELGTDVFSLGTRSGSSSNALAAVNTLVDFSLIKNYGAGEYWAANARLTGNYSLKTNTNNSQLQGALPTSGGVWDRMLGHLVAASNGATNSPTGNMVDYGWKRHAGFDVVCWEGTNGNVFRRHNLGKTPEMIIFKNRDATRNWRSYHKGLNGGTNPEDYEISLNSSSAEGSNTSYMNGTAPTSTHFVSGNDGDTNGSGDSYMALLFASVDGISKCGFYDGSSSDVTVTTGFQPRFLIVKAYNQAYSWLVLDSTRGWATSSGNNSKYLFLELNWAQNDIDIGYLTSTGFVAKGGSGNINESGASYIYYAHA